MLARRDRQFQLHTLGLSVSLSVAASATCGNFAGTGGVSIQRCNTIRKPDGNVLSELCVTIEKVLWAFFYQFVMVWRAYSSVGLISKQSYMFKR